MLAFDRFDICEAAYLLAADYNMGGFTALPTDKRNRDILTRLSKMQFKPSPLLTYRTLTTNGRRYYHVWAEAIEGS